MTGEVLADGWQARGEGGGVAVVYMIGATPAGPRFVCEGKGQVRTVLSDNGASFDRERTHTVAFSVDGMVTMLNFRAVAGPAGDDFVRRDSLSALQPLLAMLGRGKEVEIATPAGRYRLPLNGSARAVEALVKGCAG